MVVFFVFFGLKWLNRTSLWSILVFGLKGWMQRCQFSQHFVSPHETLLLESGRCCKAPSDHWIKGTKIHLAWSVSRAVAANTGLNPSYWFFADKMERIGSVLNCYISRLPFASYRLCVSLCPLEKQNKRHYLPLQKKKHECHSQHLGWYWFTLFQMDIWLVWFASSLKGPMCDTYWHKKENTFCVYIFS